MEKEELITQDEIEEEEVIIDPNEIVNEVTLDENDTAPIDDDEGEEGDSEDVDDGDDEEESLEEEQFVVPNDREDSDELICRLSNHSDSVYTVTINESSSGGGGKKDDESPPLILVTGGGDDKGFLYAVSSIEELSSSDESSAVTPITLDGHEDSVVASAVSSDRSLVATGSLDGSVKIWRVASAAAAAASSTAASSVTTAADDSSLLVQTLEGPGAGIEWIEFHPKGNVLLAGSEDGTAWMWAAQSGHCMNVFAGHSESVTCGGFSIDGKLVVTGSADGSVRVWNPKSAATEHTLGGHYFHQGAVTSLQFSRQNKSYSTSILTTGTGGLVCLSNLESGKVLRVMRGHEGSVETAAFSPTFNRAASAGLDRDVLFWDLSTGKLMGRGKAHEAAVTKLLYHPRAQTTLVSCSVDGSAVLWDERTMSPLHRLFGPKNAILSMSLTSSFLLLGGDDQKATLFNVDKIKI